MKRFFRKFSSSLVGPLLLLLMLLPAPSRLVAESPGPACAACGATGFSSLAMYCPDCGAAAGSTQGGRHPRQTGTLIVEIVYTGDSPHLMPDYGKLSVNGRYLGNIPLIERESRHDAQTDIWKQGLGHEHTALYRKEVRELDAGVVTVSLDMRFKRGQGFLRSYRSAIYPHQAIKTGERTVIRHVFSTPRLFPKTSQKALPPAPINRLEVTTQPSSTQIEYPDIKRRPGVVAIESAVFP